MYQKKNRKAVGLDAIANELLKHKAVMRILHCLFNIVLKLSVVPDKWRQAIIHPIPKTKTMTNDPLQYHGLALQSCIFKIFSQIVNDRIVGKLNENEWLAEEQNGFRKHRSCLHHIFSLTSIIRRNCKSASKGGLYCSFVDFQKAFDSIDRELMVCALIDAGIDGKILEAVKQCYQGTKNVIRINDELTDALDSDKGNNISPTIFSVYINGLLQELNNTGEGVVVHGRHVLCLAYADNIVLWSPTADGLQKLLDKTSEWCNKWRVKVNINKTKVVHFRHRRAIKSQRVFQLGEDIEMVESYKYLRLLIDSHLTMKDGIDLITSASSRAVGAIIGKTKGNQDLSYHSYKCLFDACVSPVMDYASAVWSNGQSYPKLDAVQNRAIRFFCGLPRKTPVLGLLGDMGWTPPIVRRDLEVIRLYNQIVRMPESQLTRQVMEEDLNMHNSDWSVNLCNLVESLGESESLSSRSVIPVKRVLTKLTSMYEETWQNQIKLKPKLRTYCLIKSEFKTEPYLTVNLPKWKQSLIGRLRTGTLALQLEIGRYAHIPKEEQWCELCGTEPETEVHFTVNCPGLAKTRETLLCKDYPAIDESTASIEVFKILLDKPNTFSNFIDIMWNERERLLRKDKSVTVTV